MKRCIQSPFWRWESIFFVSKGKKKIKKWISQWVHVLSTHDKAVFHTKFNAQANDDGQSKHKQMEISVYVPSVFMMILFDLKFWFLNELISWLVHHPNHSEFWFYRFGSYSFEDVPKRWFNLVTFVKRCILLPFEKTMKFFVSRQWDFSTQFLVLNLKIQKLWIN